MRAASLALLLAVAGSGLVLCREPRPPAPEPARPHELAALLEGETALLECARTRVERVAPFLEAARALPPQDASERACVDDGVARVLALPAPAGGSADAWWVALETYRSCRGELLFAAASDADLRTLSGEPPGPAQAAWLRSRLAECGTLLAALRQSKQPAG